MGTIGVRPVNPEDAAAGATEAAVEYATDGDVVTLTPEELEEMGISVDGLQEVTPEEGEAATEGAAEEAGEGEARSVKNCEEIAQGFSESGYFVHGTESPCAKFF